MILDERMTSTALTVPPELCRSTVKPKVLIMIATDPIGGPGKGLLQFLDHAPGEALEYVLCNFDVKNRPFGQFIQEARRRDLNLTLLKQRGMIDPGLILQARRIVLNHGIDLIQTHGYKSNLLGFLLSRFCRRPWVGYAHGYTDDNGKIRLYNGVDRTVLRFADRVVAVSDATRALLIRSGVREEKIRLIYNAIDLPDATPTLDAAEIRRRHGIGEKEKVIGVIGRLNPEKGQRVFLKAMERIVRPYPQWKGLIIGDGRDRSMLERQCQENGLDKAVIFAGYREDMANYYQFLDLLVLPSLSEGLPNTVLEAMSFGIPVLASAVGGVPEVLKDGNGVLVPPNDPDTLAERMIEMLRDDPARKKIGLKGRSSLHPRFSPDHRAGRIIGLYHELLANRSGQTRPS